MTLNTAFDVRDIVEFLTFIAAAAGVLFQLRGIRDQMWLQMFTEYTGRYADAIASMPFEARGPGAPLDVGGLDDDRRKAVLTAMRRYFNLCSEELYLYRQKRIDAKTWKIWEAGIRDSARGAYFTSSWRWLAADYESYRDFCDFMNDVVEGREAPSR